MVTPAEGRSTNVREVGGAKLILNSDMQNHQYVSREGVVVEPPIVGSKGLLSGDKVILHHNVFRRFRDVRGNERNSTSYFNEDTFFCQPDQIFLYKRSNEWKAVEGFCFVKPLKSNDETTLDKEHPHKGIIKYTDKTIAEIGIVEGDVVGFTPDSEYEFMVDGQRLYRIRSGDISIKYERKGNEREYNQSWSQGN